MALEGYYEMDAGSAWVDSSGNGYHGVNSGAVINTVDQKVGSGCGSFLANDEVELTTYPDISGRTAMSVMGWIKNDGVSIPNDGIFGMIDGSSNGFYLQAKTPGEGLKFLVGTNLDFGQFNGDVTSGLVHVAAVFDGAGVDNPTRLKMYHSSVAQALAFSGTIPSAIPSIIGINPTIGRVNGQARYWDGLLDNFEIYDHALTQDEIDESYNGGAGRKISNGLFFFNEE